MYCVALSMTTGARPPSAISCRGWSFYILRVRELTKRDHVSINQFIALALAEKVSELITEEYLDKQAAHASREKVERALSKVPDVEPEEADRS